MRDAERHLRPGRGSHLGQLLRNLALEDEDKNGILNHVRLANNAILEEKQIQQANEIINRNLFAIEGGRLKQQVQLGLAPPDFGRVVDSLLPLLPPSDHDSNKSSFTKDEWNEFLARHPNAENLLKDHIETIDEIVFIETEELSNKTRKVLGVDAFNELEQGIRYFALDQNGMGYNNILYISTVLGDLQEWKNNVEIDSYNALLVEEPEAHLHPQLQDLVFDFLGSFSIETQESPVQVFTSSHSPTLTSRADLDSLIMLCENDSRITVRTLGNCPLSPTEKDDLERYLDVTKAQLFFAKGVIMVEGISEALLLPVFAHRMGRSLDDNAVEIVNIGGTAFSPFAKLFNSENSKERLELPAAILTDDDRCTSRTDEYRLTDEDLHITFVDKNWSSITDLINRLNCILSKWERGRESDRAQRAKELKGGSLLTRAAYKTFEYELARIPQNVNVLLKALESIHPKIKGELNDLFSNEMLNSRHKAICLWLVVRDAKASFAQRLAALLNETNEEGDYKHAFIIPQYIVEVLKHVAPFKA